MAVNLRLVGFFGGTIICVCFLYLFHERSVQLDRDSLKNVFVNRVLQMQQQLAVGSVLPENAHLLSSKVQMGVESKKPNLIKLLNVLIFVMNLKSTEAKVFSQNKEDGVLEAIFQRIGEKHKYYVEFGVQSGMECNTRIFRERHKWKGLMMDGGFQNDAINLKKELIFPNNIVKLFQKYKVPMKFDLLSVDTDYKDFWLMQKILAAGYRPRVIISEINSFHGPTAAKTVPINRPEAMSIPNSRYFGYSVRAGWILARYYNYSMIYCESKGVNCIYIIDGEEGFGKDIRISDYLNGTSLWEPSCCLHQKPGNKSYPFTMITETTKFN